MVANIVVATDVESSFITTIFLVSLLVHGLVLGLILSAFVLYSSVLKGQNLCMTNLLYPKIAVHMAVILVW